MVGRGRLGGGAVFDAKKNGVRVTTRADGVGIGRGVPAGDEQAERENSTAIAETARGILMDFLLFRVIGGIIPFFDLSKTQGALLRLAPGVWLC
jgi:hypothetical protein